MQIHVCKRLVYEKSENMLYYLSVYKIYLLVDSMLFITTMKCRHYWNQHVKHVKQIILQDEDLIIIILVPVQ